MSRNRVLLLIGILTLCLGWFGYRKWQRYASDPARIEAARLAREEATARTRAEAVSEAQKRDFEKKVAGLRKENLDPATLFRRRYQLTEKERFPLAEDATVLTDAVPLPEEGRRPPALFLTPLYGAAADATSATTALESMLRFHLRPSVAGPVALNLVPYNHIESPYYRANSSPVCRNLKPEEYLRDATLIGADLFCYGRADLVQGNVVLQLAMVDLATSRSETFAQTVAKDRLPELLAAAVQAVTKFAGLDEAIAASRGLRPELSSLPSAAALEVAMAPGAEDRDVTASLTLLDQAGPAAPWLYEQVMHASDNDSGVEIANTALRRWPDDPRLLLSKAQLLRGAGAAYPALVLTSELVRRQPDSLIAAAQIRLSLRELLRRSESSPFLAPGYRGAYRHTDALLARQPDNWALRYDRAICSANTAFRAGSLLMADAMELTSDPQTLRREDMEKLGKKYTALAEQSLADFRAAIERRPDNPSMMTDLLFWHQRLTDGQGEDAPDKALQWQYPLLARISLIDPGNIEGDLTVAAAQAGVPGSVQLKILQDVAERTKRNPKVMIRIASNLVETLRQKMDWYNDARNRDENAKRLIGMPEAAFFAEALKIGVLADEFVWPGQANMAWLLDHADPSIRGLWGHVYNYENRHFKAAKAAQAAGKYQESLDHARRVADLLPGEDGESMHYCIVRSLWKMGRLREALYEAEVAIEEIPKKHTFHYLFAVVALELDDRLEEAYERAKIAAELDPKNPGVQETLKKVARRLDRSAE